MRKNSVGASSDLENLGHAIVSNNSRVCLGDFIQRKNARSKSIIDLGYLRKRRNTILAQSKEISEQHRVHKALGIMDRKISQMILPGILQNNGSENL